MKPVLYLLARSDLASLNPGKLAAQIAHAATAFERHIKRISKDSDVHKLYTNWVGSTPQGFGTKIVLDVKDEAGINTVLMLADAKGFDIGDIINDPTYPVRDGEVTHYISVNTCGYIFVDADVWTPPKTYELYK